MRIAILCEFGSVNGGEQSLLAALTALRGTIEPVFFAPAEGRLAEHLREAGWQHQPFDVRDPAGRRRPRDELLTELTTRIRQSGVSLVHANSLSMGRLTGRLACEIPQPCTAHLRDIVHLSRAVVEELNGNLRLFAVSAATRAAHVAQGLDPSRVDVLYNGVDLTQFHPPADDIDRRRLREELRLPFGVELAVTIGQIGLRKGLDVLAAAAVDLLRRRPQLHLLLVGERYSAKAESIDLEQRLRREFEQASPGRVHWLGYRSDIASILRGVDLLMHPARQEPFGRVLLEAAASGLPIVATAVGGTSEMLEAGQSALLVPADDPGALITAVERVLSDREQGVRLGRAARSRVCSRFAIANVAPQVASAWQALVTRNRPLQ